jgi:hypothetical protein
MGMQPGGSEGDMGHRLSLPASLPPEINHAVITGRLSADPQEGRSPTGGPVVLLRVEFPVADPSWPRSHSRCVNYLVEVPAGCSQWDVQELRGGCPVLAAGQLSDRWLIEDGHTSRCGVIVAALIKAGPPETPEGVIL